MSTRRRLPGHMRNLWRQPKGSDPATPGPADVSSVLRDAAIASGVGQLGAIQSVAPSFEVELSPVNMRDASEIERAVTAFAQSPNVGLIVSGSAAATVHRDLIIALAARHKLLLRTILRRRRRLDLVWGGSDRPVPQRRQLRRSHPQGREAGRAAGTGAEQV